MESQSDPTSEFEKETLADNGTDITDSADSRNLNAVKRKCLSDSEVDRLQLLTNGLNKTSDDLGVSENRAPPTRNGIGIAGNKVQTDGLFGNDNPERCMKDMGYECPRDSNSHCHCSNRSEESQSNIPASPASTESPNDSLDASRFDEIISVDLRRTRRNFKRKKDSDLCCPVCSLTLREPELESHFNQEVEKLSKIPKTARKPKQDDSGINTTFVQVRSNRLNRLTAKVAHYTEKAKSTVKCPVCKLLIYGSEEEMNNHVALCFQNDESDDPINVEDDDDDDESFEEYEFGDQTRIRAISLVPGGYRSLQGQNAKRSRVEDEDLDVDIDDTIAFGQPQYSELDVILNKNGEDKASDQLRKAVLVDPSIQPHVLESRKWFTNEDVSEYQENLNDTSITSAEDSNGDQQSSEQNFSTTSGHIISSLKEKIKDLGDQSKNVKCLICMEPYTKPVVSTTCWHVHCEECWLMTMGVKKLCPQCNMIVFPTDLRRIYL